MGKYDGWDRLFESLTGDEVNLSFEDLEAAIEADLPPSAFKHHPWWSSAHYHAKWSDHGWRAHPDLQGRVVRFDRIRTKRHEPPVAPLPLGPSAGRARLVLVGCVAQKKPVPAPAKDLYVSDLWRKRRSYAESTGQPWMILSAEHGLVDPTQILTPYDRSMQTQPRAYREEWSRATARAVVRACRESGVRTVEIHAGAAYAEHGLEQLLQDAGIEVLRPVEGLRIGEQLRWYRQQPSGATRV